MLSVPLSEQPDFNALSYMWVNAEANTYIIIDGLTFLVRHNLLMFLKRYSQEERPKPIWIDAICINQLDLQERTQQVQIMGEIRASSNCCCMVRRGSIERVASP